MTSAGRFRIQSASERLVGSTLWTLGLLRSSGHSQAEYMLHERLASYNLAWSAWSSVNSVLQAIQDAVPDGGIEFLDHNFDLPQQWQIPSPDDIEAVSKNDPSA